MWNTVNIITFCKPKYVIWENVKNLLSKKHKHNFDSYISILNSLGYNSYYQVLNAKDYGIPQNRERVYTVSIRKDIDKGSFTFPEKEELKLRLKDMLENEVDEKYYLSDVQIERIKTTTYNVGKTRIQEKEYCDTLCARDWKDPKCVRIGGIFDTETSKHQAGSIYDKEGLCPTLDVAQGGWRQPSVIIKDRIRKLTPREYWRLMGFGDKDFENAQSIPMSNTQLYKQAGNSIVVNVLEKIFKNLFMENKNENEK